MLDSTQKLEVSNKSNDDDVVITIIPSILVHKLETSQQIINFRKINKSNREWFEKMEKEQKISG